MNNKTDSEFRVTLKTLIIQTDGFKIVTLKKVKHIK